MPRALYISHSRNAAPNPRPASQRTLYCDGSHDSHWREGVDLELSHWVPNVTPPAFRADTSTGIALRFVDAGEPGGGDLVVNDHVDTDGSLASLVLCQPARCAPHAPVLVQAAAVGDFGAWADTAALRLYQWLTTAREQLRTQGVDEPALALRLHALVLDELDQPRRTDDAGVQAVQRAADAVDSGRITRELLAPRLVHYIVPRALVPDAPDRPDPRRWAPRTDLPLQPGAVLPPPVRNRLDGQRLQIVSLQTDGGWWHDLAWPGYSWADTATLWRPPGLQPLPGSDNLHALQLPLLDEAVARLNGLEAAQGRPDGIWQRATSLGVFQGLPGRAAPVVLSCSTARGTPATSRLAPQQVAAVLAPVLA